MTKRIQLKSNGPLGMQGTSVEAEDAIADQAIKDGLAELSADQIVYNHESEIKVKKADKK